MWKRVSSSASVFTAVADPTRRAILDRLARGDLVAGEVARPFPVSRPAISRHLRVLREAGLVRERRVGRLRVYSARLEPLSEIDEWLTRQKLAWAARLVELKHEVENRGEARRGGSDGA